MTIIRRICIAAILTFTIAACGDASADDSDGVATLAAQATVEASPDAESQTPDAGASDAPASDARTAAASETTAPEPEPTVEEELDDEAQLLAFAACMRDEGVNMPDPTVDSDGNAQLVPPQDLDISDPGARDAAIAARDACAVHLEGLELGFAGQDDTEFQDQLLEFTQCMRDNGYDMPDIELGGPGGIRGADGIDQDDPAFVAAQDVCQDILAGFGPGAGPAPAEG